MFLNLCLAQVQVTTADPVVVAVVQPSSGVGGWLALHGGFTAAIILIVFSAFTVVSAIREILLKYDGVAPGAPIPPGLTGLTLVNKICVILGKILDFMQGNTAH